MPLAAMASQTFLIIGSSWGTNANPAEAAPGSQNVPLVITLEYYGPSTATSVKGSLALSPGFLDTTGASTALAFATNQPANTIFQLTFNLNIASTLATASYTFPLTLNWNTTGARNLAETDTVQTSLNGQAKLNFMSTIQSLLPGSVNNVTVSLTNQGTGTASQVSIITLPPLSISILGQLAGVVSLAPSASVTQSFQVFVPMSLAGSSVSISFTASYKDAYLISRGVTQTIGFYVTSLQPSVSPISLSVQPLTLTSGKVNNLTVTFSNTGAYSVTRLTSSFSFLGGQITWLLPDIFQVQSLAPGSNATVQAKVYAPPLSTTTTTLQVSLKFYDSNNALTAETRNLGLLAKGVVQLTLVDLSTVPQNPMVGQIFSVTATVTNIGTITASAVTATPQVPAGRRIFGSKSVFVGDMQVNTPTTFTISFFVRNDSQPGNYQVPIQLAYLDNLRDQLSTPLSVSVQVVGNSTSITTGQRQRSPGLSLTLVLLVAIVVVITLVIGYFVGKRSARK